MVGGVLITNVVGDILTPSVVRHTPSVVGDVLTPSGVGDILTPSGVGNILTPSVVRHTPSVVDDILIPSVVGDILTPSVVRHIPVWHAAVLEGITKVTLSFFHRGPCGMRLLYSKSPLRRRVSLGG